MPCKWLIDGDRNRSFFHSLCRRHKTIKLLFRLQNNGASCFYQNVIHEHVIYIFKDLFTDKNNTSLDLVGFSQAISIELTQIDNDVLTSVPLEVVVW